MSEKIKKKVNETLAKGKGKIQTLTFQYVSDPDDEDVVWSCVDLQLFHELRSKYKSKVELMKSYPGGVDSCIVGRLPQGFYFEYIIDGIPNKSKVSVLLDNGKSVTPKELVKVRICMAPDKKGLVQAVWEELSHHAPYFLQQNAERLVKKLEKLNL